MTKLVWVVFAALILLPSFAFSAEYDKAVMLHRHGLHDDAKRELIDLIFAKDVSDPEKARGYYLLGSIAAESGAIRAALQTFNELIARYPKSPEAEKAGGIAKALTDVFGEKSTELITDAVAAAYLSNAEFWSRGKDEVYSLDLSYLDRIDGAIQWYDRILVEFPKTPAAEVAYIGKLRTLLGWTEAGKYGSAYGIQSEAASDKARYMSQLVSTFRAFEKDFPGSSSLQPFRFQIAQAYWAAADFAKAEEWLKAIIAQGEAHSFYVDLAVRRQAKLKY